MSKLKLYYHSKESQKELIEDVKNSIAELEKMGEASALSFTNGDKGEVFEYMKNQYSEDLKKLLRDDLGYESKLQIFEEFSKNIDTKYEINDKVDFNSRVERDLIKYQALCLVESKMIKELVAEGSKAALDYVEEINSIDNKVDQKTQYQLHQKAFSKFTETYKAQEDPKKIIGNPVCEELLKINNETKAIFTNLVPNMNSKENSSLVASIGNIRSQDNKFSSIGKRSYAEWFGDMWREMKNPIVKIIDAISHIISLDQKSKSTEMMIAENHSLAEPMPRSAEEAKEMWSNSKKQSMEITIAENHSLSDLMPRTPEEAMKMWGPPPKPPIDNKIKEEVDKIRSNDIIGEKTKKLSEERSGELSPKSVTMVR